MEQNVAVLKKGVALCQQQQQALLRVGASILEKRAIHVAEYFRYTYLTDLTEADAAVFSQVLVALSSDP